MAQRHQLTSQIHVRLEYAASLRRLVKSIEASQRSCIHSNVVIKQIIYSWISEGSRDMQDH